MKKYLNIILLISIFLYNIFLNNLDFRYDFILTFILFIINIKNIYQFLIKYKIFACLLISYILFALIQTIVLNQSDFSIITVIYQFMYICVTTLFPIIFLIVFNNLGLEENEIKIINKILIISTIILIIYGYITFIFDINLNIAGMYVLDDVKGRVSSLLLNPNGYAFYLNCILIYFLFNTNFNKILKWIMVCLIVSSICLTFSRYMYFIMGLIVFVYIIYNLIIKNNNYKWLNISLITLIVILSFNLPNNNYLYISLINQFDEKFETKIAKPVYNIIDSFVFVNHNTNSDKLYERIADVESRPSSSTGTRKTFKKYALELYEENKLLGVGILNYHDLVDKKIQEAGITNLESGLPHNYYILLLASTGIVGSIIMLSILGYLFYYIYSQRKNNLLVPIFIYIAYLLANLEADFIIRNILLYFIIAISINLVYNKNVNKE